MIAVIADDFTGAAEIAGLGWRHGLHAEIIAWADRRTGVAPVSTFEMPLGRDEAKRPARRPSHEPDLLVLDSDSRNLSPVAARKRVRDLALELRSRQPAWVFKKVDSVLRGNVLAEISSLGRALSLPRTLLVPANPNAGRTIREGVYYVGGTPIHRTDFRNDPRHPRRSPHVLELLGKSGAIRVSLQTVGAKALSPGINVGEVSTFADVQQWAEVADKMTLVAGGADFFRALLERRTGVKSEVRSPKSEVRRKNEIRKPKATARRQFQASALGFPRSSTVRLRESR